MNDFLFGHVDEEAADDRIVWSTEKIEQLNHALSEGAKIKVTLPYYEGNMKFRRSNVVFDYTDHELSEIKKCAKDIVYFAENYACVMTDNGIQRIKLRDYQIDMLRQFAANRFNITLASRQIGKTICTAIFVAWYLLFNFDKNALILANKGATTKEIIDKMKAIIENLPFFMKPGVVKNDVFEMKYDNGCRMVGQTTTGKAGIGFTIHLLFLDEFAHIHHSFLDGFFENVYPTLSSSQISRIIITSTPNGYNKFYELYKAATEGLNEFTPFKVDWWQVPGRDEKWKERETKNLGSEEAFNRQYGNQFMASSNLLLQGSTLKRMQQSKKKYIHRELEQFEHIQIDMTRFLGWDPDFRMSDCKDDEKYHVFSVDIADGSGGDYSVINIFQINLVDKKYWKYFISPSAMKDFFGLTQVARFTSNEHSIEDFSKILYTLAVEVFHSENTKLVIEWNYNGGLVLKNLQTLFPQRNNFDEEMVCRFKHRHDAKRPEYGLKVKKDNKIVFCQNFKKAIELRRILINDEDTIKQYETFGKLPSGSYGAQMGHDDMAMTGVNVTEFFGTPDFSDYVEEMLDMIPESMHSQLEEILSKDSGGDGNMDYDIYDLVK